MKKFMTLVWLCFAFQVSSVQSGSTVDLLECDLTLGSENEVSFDRSGVIYFAFLEEGKGRSISVTVDEFPKTEESKHCDFEVRNMCFQKNRIIDSGMFTVISKNGWAKYNFYGFSQEELTTFIQARCL